MFTLNVPSQNSWVHLERGSSMISCIKISPTESSVPLAHLLNIPIIGGYSTSVTARLVRDRGVGGTFRFLASLILD